MTFKPFWDSNFHFKYQEIVARSDIFNEILNITDAAKEAKFDKILFI